MHLSECMLCLKVKILRLLRMLGKGDSDTSEAMNDILAQVGSANMLILLLSLVHFSDWFFMPLPTVHLEKLGFCAVHVSVRAPQTLLTLS